MVKTTSSWCFFTKVVWFVQFSFAFTMEKAVYMQILGDNIREMRKKKRLTMENVAAQAGLAYSQINRIELGKRCPSVYTLWLISNVLGVCFSDLLPEGMHRISEAME